MRSWEEGTFAISGSWASCEDRLPRGLVATCLNLPESVPSLWPILGILHIESEHITANGQSRTVPH
jgi:hypothetical protein